MPDQLELFQDDVAIPAWVTSFASRHPECALDTATGRWGDAVAVFSPDRVHRYLLTRTWDPELPPVVFVMLNPSTADAFVLDRTVHRCATFSQRWGGGGLVVANIFALRSTDPKGLYVHPDPVGPVNDDALLSLPADAVATIAAWGVHGMFGGREAQARDLLAGAGRPDLRCLGTTKGGHPRHPLYVKGDTIPTPFS